jgi:hypothetical protein
LQPLGAETTHTAESLAQSSGDGLGIRDPAPDEMMAHDDERFHAEHPAEQAPGLLRRRHGQAGPHLDDAQPRLQAVPHHPDGPRSLGGEERRDVKSRVLSHCARQRHAVQDSRGAVTEEVALAQTR